jgi:uncharacterized phage-associated protein
MENNIIYDSYYLINLYGKDKDKKEVTQLQIQKLMYLFEAFYMNITNRNRIYDCDFSAWTFGPIALPLYNEYKIFDSKPIVLTGEQIKAGNKINFFKKVGLDKIYDTFGNLSEKQLINLIHMEGSPWFKKWMDNNQKIVCGEKGYIDKSEMKNWFKENFIGYEE